MRDKFRYYYEPISQETGFKVTYDGEKSEVIPGGWVKDFVVVRKRLFRLKSRKDVKNELQWNNIAKKAVVKIIEIDPIKVTLEKKNKNEWIQEESKNIDRVASANNEQKTGPLLLPENG